MAPGILEMQHFLRYLLGLLMLVSMSTGLFAQDPQKSSVDTKPANAKPPAKSKRPQFELPADIEGLLKLKAETIPLFRGAKQKGVSEDAITFLDKIFMIEMKLLKSVEAELGPDNLTLLDTYGSAPQTDGTLLGDEYRRAGRYEEALEVLDSVVLVVLHRTHSTVFEYAEIASLRDQVKRLVSLNEQDRKAYRQALDQCKVANQLFVDKKYGEAADQQGPAIETLYRLNQDSVSLASEIGAYANMMQRAERFDQVEKTFRRALEMFTRTIGKENARYAATLFNYAIFLRDRGRSNDAIPLLKSVSKIEQRVGIARVSQLQTIDALAAMYKKTGRSEEEFDQLVREYRLIEWASPLGLQKTAKLIPHDAFLGMTVAPAGLISNRKLSFLPIEIQRAMLVESWGINPGEIETATFFVMTPISKGEVHFGMILKPVANIALKPQLQGEFGAGSYKGFSYAKMTQSPEGILCHAPLPTGDYFIGSELALHKVLDLQKADPAQSQAPNDSIASQLQQMHSADGIQICLDVNRVRSFLQVVLNEVPLPARLEGVKNLGEHLATLRVNVSFAKEPLVGIQLVPSSPARSKDIQDSIRELSQFAYEQIMNSMDSMVNGSEDPIANATKEYASRIAKVRLNAIQPVETDGMLTMELGNISDVQAPVLVALLLPAIQSARQAAQRMNGSNNLKQVALGMHNYHDVYGRLPTQTGVPKGKGDGLSWRVHILPYLGELELYEQFHLDEPWDSAHNKALIEKMPTVFRSDREPKMPPGKTNIVSLIGSDTCMNREKGLRFQDFTDGTSNTIMVVEANHEKAVIWTQPEDLPFDKSHPLNGLGQSQAGGFQVAFVDGSVQLIEATISQETFKAMVTRNGGEVVNRP